MHPPPVSFVTLRTALAALCKLCVIKSPKKNTKITRAPRTPKCLGAVVLAHPGRILSHVESCKHIPEPLPNFPSGTPLPPYVSCFMTSRVRSVMVVSLFGGGGSVNVSGSSWCTVTVSSKPNKALFGEDVFYFQVS